MVGHKPKTQFVACIPIKGSSMFCFGYTYLYLIQCSTGNAYLLAYFEGHPATLAATVYIAKYISVHAYRASVSSTCSIAGLYCLRYLTLIALQLSCIVFRGMYIHAYVRIHCMNCGSPGHVQPITNY